MLERVLEVFGLQRNSTITPFGNGLINRTWKVTEADNAYILQKINHKVFAAPLAIAANISSISRYLQQHQPQYIFPTPLTSVQGKTMLHLEEDGYYRVFPFVNNSHSIDVVTTAKQAYEAARAFGKFTRLLANFDATQLHITLHNFHNLTLRYQQFQQALTNGNMERIEQAQELIQELQAQQNIAAEYEAIRNSGQFKIRVTHHDTKISNVLFDNDDNSLCVIDLDTVMPGYFISDVGDMMRTYLSPVSEEEKDLSLMEVRDDYFKAIVCGYLHEMNEELTEKEKGYFVYAGKFMIYMQALRFLTDHLNNDVYYGAAYPNHNLLRAQNQAALLRHLCRKEAQLQALVTEALESFAATPA